MKLNIRLELYLCKDILLMQILHKNKNRYKACKRKNISIYKCVRPRTNVR